MSEAGLVADPSVGLRPYSRSVSSFQAANLPSDVDRQVKACEDLLGYLHHDLLPTLPPPSSTAALGNRPRAFRRRHRLLRGRSESARRAVRKACS